MYYWGILRAYLMIVVIHFLVAIYVKYEVHVC